MLKCEKHGNFKIADTVRIIFDDYKYILICEECLINWFKKCTPTDHYYYAVISCMNRVEHRPTQENYYDVTVDVNLRSDNSIKRICKHCLISAIYEGNITSSYKRRK